MGSAAAAAGRLIASPMVPSGWSADPDPGRIAPEAMFAFATLGWAADRTRLTSRSASSSDVGLAPAVRRRVRTTLGPGVSDPAPANRS